MTFEEVAQFFGAFLGRPYCRIRVVPKTKSEMSVCWWTPSDDLGGNGYIDDYPPNVWKEHIQKVHPELLRSADSPREEKAE